MWEESIYGFYAWCRRRPSAQHRRDQALLRAIQRAHGRSRGTYGAPRIHAELAEQGYATSRKRVARLMRRGGLRGVTRRKGVRTTTPAQQERPAPDRVDRDFRAEAPDSLWVADITYVPTASGFLYLAVVLDVFSRRVVGWSMAGHLRTELVLSALEMAVRSRRPESVIHHSDQGCQYAPPWPSASIAGKPASISPWARSATASTTPWPRASLPPWSAS